MPADLPPALAPFAGLDLAPNPSLPLGWCSLRAGAATIFVGRIADAPACLEATGAELSPPDYHRLAEVVMGDVAEVAAE